MCLGIPMQIISLSTDEQYTATCTQNGIQREVNTYLLHDQSLQTGDYVLVHVGYAIQKVDSAQAKQSETLFNEMQSGANTDA